MKGNQPNFLKDYRFEIRKYRRKLNLTQNKLAKLTGLSQSYISHIERGIRNPTIKDLEKITDVLKLNFYSPGDTPNTDSSEESNKPHCWSFLPIESGTFHLITGDFFPEFRLNREIFFDWETCSECKECGCENALDFKPPREIEDIKPYLIQQKIKEYQRHSNFTPHNSILGRLARYNLMQDKDREERQIINLYFCRTYFYDFMITNLNSNKLIEIYGNDFIVRNSKHNFANVQGTQLLLYNKKNKEVFLTTRGNMTSHYSGCYQVSCGGQVSLENQRDIDKEGKPNAFITIREELKREIAREVAKDLDLDEIVCLGFGMNLEYGQPILLFEAETYYSVNQVLRLAREERFEIEKFLTPPIRYDPREIEKVLKSESFVPESAVCCQLFIRKHWPDYKWT